jgi:glutamate-1-semialdehyde 2,1-aminomutase
VIDETHCFSAGPGGCTRAFALDPDVVTIGKAIAGGIPTGAFGLAADLAARVLQDPEGDYVDVGGVGGTLAGNPLQLAALRATLGEVLTEEAFARMERLAIRYAEGIEAAIEAARLPWTIARLGCRAEWRFCHPAPRNGAESAAAHDEDLDQVTHLYLLNRGVLLTPFHAMALMSPDTSEADVDLAVRLFGECVDALT